MKYYNIASLSFVISKIKACKLIIIIADFSQKNKYQDVFFE